MSSTPNERPSGFAVSWLPLAQLHAAGWNANRVDDATLKKIRRSIELFDVLENSVVRPCHCESIWETHYEVISGNHRLAIYQQLEITPVPCVIRELDDGMARILADTLNRTRGHNDREAYEELVRVAAGMHSADTVASLMMETEKTLAMILHDQARQTPPAHWRGIHQVVVEVAGPDEQQALYERLSGEGFSCKLLTM